MIAGEKHNRLTAICPDTNKKGLWIFRCDCGTIKSIKPYNVASGSTKSCGCLNNELIHRKQRNGKDITGNRYGKLVAVRYDHSNNNGTYWLCKCDCGNTAIVNLSQITSGNTKSCGCLGLQNQQEQAEKSREKNYVEGTHIGNISKQEPNKNNKLGVRGVWYNSKTKRYTAYICLKGKTKTLIRTRNLDEAIEARKKAEEELFKPFLESLKND